MPAALLAFANDWVDDKRHLRELLEEAKAINKALAPLVKAGLDLRPAIHNATVGDVIGAFREHRDQIRVFHFGGHASGSTLLFEDEAGNPTEAHANGLASYLGQQRGLVLVFLNGCCTRPQIKRLREAGVKAVVATTQAIQDGVAAAFAEAFYSELVTRPLRDAFDAAAHAMETRWGDDPRSVTRDVEGDEEPSTPSWPWVIDCDPAYETWRLRSEIDRRRAWRRRLAFAITAVAVPLTTSLAFSAEARRTACRVPGLHALCQAVGVGVAGPEEQMLWDHARAQRSGNGLRAYEQRYPNGFYANEAHVRLDACVQAQVETAGPERDITHRYAVAIGRPFADKAAAHANALARGKVDAVEHCATLRSAAVVLSASIEPGDWTCIDYDHEVACGLDAVIVCHVRDRIRTLEERCEAPAAGGEQDMQRSGR